MALTVNGKKRNIRKKDFLLLADSLDLNRKTAEKLMSKICKVEKSFLEEIEISLLPDDMKESMSKLLSERISIFQ